MPIKARRTGAGRAVAVMAGWAAVLLGSTMPAPAVAARPTTGEDFSLDAAAPLFSGPASVAFRQKRYVEAARGFEAFLAQRPSTKEAPAQLLAGLARARSADPAGAARHLRGLAPRLASLGTYARYFAAEQLLELKQPAEALAELQGCEAGTPLDRPILLLRARALRAQDKLDEAAGVLDELLRQAPVRPEGLAEAASLARQRGRKAQAAELERTLWVSHPLSAAARSLDKPERVTADEHLQRGRAFYEVHRHAEALEQFEAALEAKAPQYTRCAARFLRGHTQFKAQRYKDAVGELERYLGDRCPGAGGLAEKARALYYAGRAAARSGQPDQAVRYFERLVAEVPGSSLADDVLLLQAEVLYDKGDVKGARAALQQVIDRFAKGDMLEEAWWRLTWERYRAGDLPGALELLQRAAKAGVHGTEYYNRGRLTYWRARIQGRSGQRERAVESYRRLVREEPLGYYAQLAANRLRITDPRHLRDLPGAPGRARAWTFAHRPLFDKPAFRRGVALLSLGLGPEAKREFELLGLLDGGQGAGREQELWLAALLFERAGMPQRSHDLVRREIPGYQRSQPDDDHAAQWQVAYPRPFEPEARAAASEAGVPVDLLYGLMREESGFSPDVVSYAQAIGLTQLLLSTARSTAAGLRGVEASETSLRDPATNLRLGARFLRSLLDQFHHPLLAIAGYNAGGHRVSRWNETGQGLLTDEWVEAIPYEQTRNYAKRVLESYGRYRFLYGEGKERFLVLPVRPDQAPPTVATSRPATAERERPAAQRRAKGQAASKSKGKGKGKGAGKATARKSSAGKGQRGAEARLVDPEDLPESGRGR